MKSRVLARHVFNRCHALFSRPSSRARLNASAGALRNLTAEKRTFESAGRPEAAAIEAFHVEGPHISPEDGPRGAHPREFVRPPDIEEFKRWQEAADGLVRLVTVSPEWPETPDYIRAVTRTGVVVSVGHTKATGEQIRAAVDAGATMSTHLGNGAHSVLPRQTTTSGISLRKNAFRPALFWMASTSRPRSFVQPFAQKALSIRCLSPMR